MSKITNVIVNGSSVEIFLESGVFLKDFYDDSIISIFNNVVDDIVGIEIFDQVSLDNIIKRNNDGPVFSVSCIFLKLGAMDMDVPLFRYIGDCDLIPSVMYSVSIDNINEKIFCFDFDGNSDFVIHTKGDINIKYNEIKYLIVDVEKFLTVTDLIDYIISLRNKRIILFSKNDIICDLAVGLGISFILIKRFGVIDRLFYINDVL